MGEAGEPLHNCHCPLRFSVPVGGHKHSARRSVTSDRDVCTIALDGIEELGEVIPSLPPGNVLQRHGQKLQHQRHSRDHRGPRRVALIWPLAGGVSRAAVERSPDPHASPREASGGMFEGFKSASDEWVPPHRLPARIAVASATA